MLHGNAKLTPELNELVASGYVGTQPFVDSLNKYRPAKDAEIVSEHAADRQMRPAP